MAVCVKYTVPHKAIQVWLARSVLEYHAVVYMRISCKSTR